MRLKTVGDSAREAFELAIDECKLDIAERIVENLARCACEECKKTVAEMR